MWIAAVSHDSPQALLNSGDAFVLLSPGKVWVWYGAGVCTRLCTRLSLIRVVDDQPSPKSCFLSFHFHAGMSLQKSATSAV